MTTLPPLNTPTPLRTPVGVPPGPEDQKPRPTHHKKEVASERTNSPPVRSDVLVVKFMTEYKLYPNGAIYHSKTYQCGMPTAHKGKKKVVKKEVVKLQEAITEETL